MDPHKAYSIVCSVMFLSGEIGNRFYALEICVTAPNAQR